jgi:hypothetical protein
MSARKSWKAAEPDTLDWGMVPIHETSIDCLRRAQLPNQTFEGR